MGQYANRTRRNIPNENRGPRYNHPSRSHPTYLPHPGTAITTNRAKPRIWPRGGKTGPEEDRMVPSNLSPPGSTSGTEEPPSLGNRSLERQLKHGGYPGLSYICGNTHHKDPRDEPRFSKRGRGCRHRISLYTEIADEVD